jgi:hypothetical protein
MNDRWASTMLNKKQFARLVGKSWYFNLWDHVHFWFYNSIFHWKKMHRKVLRREYLSIYLFRFWKQFWRQFISGTLWKLVSCIGVFFLTISSISKQEKFCSKYHWAQKVWENLKKNTFFWSSIASKTSYYLLQLNAPTFTLSYQLLRMKYLKMTKTLRVFQPYAAVSSKILPVFKTTANSRKQKLFKKTKY